MASENKFLDATLDEFLSQARFAPPKITQPLSAVTAWTLLLTGTTGSLGTYILAALQECPPERVQKVYCLNRAPNAKRRQSTSLSLRDLPPLNDDRFVFLEANFGSPRLGLSPEIYNRLLDEVTVVFHNAWTVNFVLPIQDFIPCLIGQRNFLQFSYQSSNHPPVLFVSSLGIAYASDTQHIEEKIYHDLSIGDGYSQSKYVAEQMLETYTLSSGLPTAVIRVGQISGPVRSAGIWPAREWFPTLLRASKHLDVLPQTLGAHNDIDWIPVDVLSQIIVEITEYAVTQASRNHDPPIVFNVANPATVSFASLLPHLAVVASKTVPCEEWARLLEQRASEPATPGAKLLGFYKRILTSHKPLFETETGNLTAASPTARGLPSVNKAWLLNWLGQWGYRPRPIDSHL